MTTRMAMLLILCLLPTTVQADEPLSRAPWKERAVLRAGQVVQGDYFAFGPHVEISGIVNGDLYAAGGEVLIDGVVNGDVIVAGAKVILSGTVAQDARVAGAQVVSISLTHRHVVSRERCSSASDMPVIQNHQQDS